MRPYTRSLDPADYAFLAHAEPIRAFQRAMTAPHCISHPHKIWENASIMQQLDELRVPKDARILDVGSGGMFFPPYLVVKGGYTNVELTDSMDNMDIAPYVQAQCQAYNIEMPVHKLRAEDMSTLSSDTWDVVMCISVIEHIWRQFHHPSLLELVRLTKPGGLIFLTSDYFRSVDGHEDTLQYEASPFRDGQHNPYHKEFVLGLPDLMGVEFVGETDLDYRGDFVHNYSFVNVCLSKRAASTLDRLVQ